MNVLFKTSVVRVSGANSYVASVAFDSYIDRAEVALRGLVLTKYTDNTEFHYRGPTLIRINEIEIYMNTVTFTFNFNFSENSRYQMTGEVEFLVIAVPKLLGAQAT